MFENKKKLFQPVPFVHGTFYLLLLALCFTGCASIVRKPAFLIDRESKSPKVLRGAYHVHSKYSEGTKASLDRIIAAAQKNDLDFVVITDHNNRDAAKDYYFNPYPKRPKLIIGEEVSAPDGHITVIGTGLTAPKNFTSQQIIDWAHERGGYAFLAHPVSVRNPWRNWDVTGYDGLEVYNMAHTFSGTNKLTLPFKVGLLPDSLFLKSFYENPDKASMIWKSVAENRRVVAVSAVDAHLHQSWLGFDPENYALQLQGTTLHVLSQVLEEKFVTSAIGLGHSFIVMEFLGKASDFSFSIFNTFGEFFIGDTLKFTKGTLAKINVPRKSQIRLYRNGNLVLSKVGTELLADLNEPGDYRVDVYRGKKLWIISNPIYVTS